VTTPIPAHSSNGPSAIAPGDRIYVGIDVGYRTHVAAAIPLAHFDVARHHDRWKRAKPLSFSTDAAGFAKLQRYLDPFSSNPADFLILLEPTGGFYALSLLSYLLSRSYAVLQVENTAVKDYREKTFGSETKTDHTDARLMARMGFLHEVVGEEFSIQPVQISPPDQAALRLMVRDLVKLQKEITRRTNQLQQVIAVTFPELKSFLTNTTASVTARALLERYPTPEALSRASPDEIRAVLWSRHAYGHAKRAEELLTLARASVGVKQLVHHQWRQAWLIKQLPGLEQARQELILQLRQVIEVHPYTPIIESLPVKSTIWTATLIGVIGKVERFVERDGLAGFKAYLGWWPQKAASGTSLNSSRLASKAVRLSRNVLGQMVAVLLSPNMRSTPFRLYYERLVARGMPSPKARGHVAGKLAELLYYMLKTLTPYDEQRHQKAMGFSNPGEVTMPVPADTLEGVAQTLTDDPDLLEESST